MIKSNFKKVTNHTFLQLVKESNCITGNSSVHWRVLGSKWAPKGNQLYLLNHLSYRPLPYSFGNGRKFPNNCGDVSPLSPLFRRACNTSGLVNKCPISLFYEKLLQK